MSTKMMERGTPASTSSSSSSSTTASWAQPSRPSSRMELDPLLLDLSEKKQSFRNSVVALASELKDVRARLAQQEHCFAYESRTRQAAETKAKTMEDHICILQKSLQAKEQLLEASTCATQQHVKELDELRSQLSAAQAAADASEASAQSAQTQCTLLLKELDVKNRSLKEHEERVNKLAEQLDLLQRDLQGREQSQKQLRDEVLRVEKEITLAVVQAGDKKECELRKLLGEISPKNIENINKHLCAKDEEISRLRDEIKSLSAFWKMKTKELESQLEKQQRADQDLKKRILKLEFCLQEARAQTKKLQRLDERRERAIKELREQLEVRQLQQNEGGCHRKQSFWETTAFKIGASMSMFVLVVFARK